MLNRLRHALREPSPLRFLLLRWLDRRLDLFSYSTKLEIGSIERPHYGHGVLHAALLAKRLGHSAVTAIEFGVAGGNGLLNLQMHAERVTKETGVQVAIYGFDTGAGMPPPLDYRDIPYLWQAGYFRMDQEKLRSRIGKAKLIIGNVGQTVRSFCEAENPPPIGFISFDLDYYSSTLSAMQIFTANHKHVLPRVACYFDDMVGDIDWAYNEFTGELLAISEFNEAHPSIKIAPVRGLRFFGQRLPAVWHEQIFVAHLFEHPDYGRPTSELTQLPLGSERKTRPTRRAASIIGLAQARDASSTRRSIL